MTSSSSESRSYRRKPEVPTSSCLAPLLSSGLPHSLMELGGVSPGQSWDSQGFQTFGCTARILGTLAKLSTSEKWLPSRVFGSMAIPLPRGSNTDQTPGGPPQESSIYHPTAAPPVALTKRYKCFWPWGSLKESL